MYDTQKRFSGNLHALRGLAATSVVFFHAKNMGPATDVGILSIVQQFGAGVTLFFILSGFSLSLSNYEKIDNGNWLRGYTIKRLARILPVWYVFVAIHFFYHWIKYGVVHSFSELIYHVVPIYSLVAGGHESFVWAGWTIGVELLFYALFPFLLVCIRNKIWLWLLALLGAILLSINLKDFAPADLAASYYYLAFPNQAFVFILGCALYFIVDKSIHLKKEKLLSLALGAMTIACFLYWTLAVMYPATVKMGVFALLIKALALGGLTSVAYINIGNRVNLLNPLTKFLGDKSYTIYLAHPIVVAETKRFYPAIKSTVSNTELSFVIYSILVLGITFSVSAVISTYFEAPIYKYGRQAAN